MTRPNGHDGNGAPPSPPSSPLPKDTALEIRRGVGRLISGARELAAIAVIAPIFLSGALLAAEGIGAASGVARGRSQRGMDLVLFGGYAVVLIALAIRARIGAARATKLLPDALADDPVVRAVARERMLRLAGPAFMRRLSDWMAARGCALLLGLAIAAVVAWIFLPTPDPIWLVVFVGTAVAMDVRWRALVADVADQMPR